MLTIETKEIKIERYSMPSLKKIAILIPILFITLLWSKNNNWTLDSYLSDNNETEYTLNYYPNHGQVLPQLLSKVDKPFAIRIMLNAKEEPLQTELKEYYKKQKPKALKKALASSRNLHNPTLEPLIEVFPEAFRSTTFYKTLEKNVESQGFSIQTEISFEKFSIDKTDNSYTFYADIWLHTIKLKEMLKVAQKLSPKQNEANLTETLKTGAWSYDKNEVIVNLENKIYLFMTNTSGNVMAVDLSKVEKSNIGKIGPNRHYEKVQTKVTEWLEDSPSKLQIKLETTAWSKGKRYRAFEPLIVQRDGKVLWR